MGTRALVQVYDEQDKMVLNLFAQSDGYPSGLGKTLHDELGHIQLVNGLQTRIGVANGMCCFAAQVVAALKTCAGNVYLEAPSEETSGVEFVYTFRPNKLGVPVYGETPRHLVFTVVGNYHIPTVLYKKPFSKFTLKAVEKATKKADKAHKEARGL